MRRSILIGLLPYFIGVIALVADQAQKRFVPRACARQQRRSGSWQPRVGARPLGSVNAGLPAVGRPLDRIEGGDPRGSVALAAPNREGEPLRAGGLSAVAQASCLIDDGRRAAHAARLVCARSGDQQVERVKTLGEPADFFDPAAEARDAAKGDGALAAAARLGAAVATACTSRWSSRWRAKKSRMASGSTRSPARDGDNFSTSTSTASGT